MFVYTCGRRTGCCLRHSLLSGKPLVSAQAPSSLAQSDAMSESSYAPSMASDSSALCRTPSVQLSVATGPCCWMECGTSEHLTDIGNARSMK